MSTTYVGRGYGGHKFENGDRVIAVPLVHEPPAGKKNEPDVAVFPGREVDPESVPAAVFARWLRRGLVEEYVPDGVLEAQPSVEEPFPDAGSATVPDYLAGVEDVLEEADESDRLPLLARAWAFEHENRGRRGVYEGLLAIGDSLDT